MQRFFYHLRLAFWRAFEHDAFAVAKAAAFSAILTLFPAVLVLASILSRSNTTESVFREIYRAVGRILPEGTSTAVLQVIAKNARAITLDNSRGSIRRPIVDDYNF